MRLSADLHLSVRDKMMDIFFITEETIHMASLSFLLMPQP
jgi:hypothetical protein